MNWHNCLVMRMKTNRPCCLNITMVSGQSRTWLSLAIFHLLNYESVLLIKLVMQLITQRFNLITQWQGRTPFKELIGGQGVLEQGGIIDRVDKLASYPKLSRSAAQTEVVFLVPFIQPKCFACWVMAMFNSLLKIIGLPLGLFIAKDFIKNSSLINAEAKPRHSDIHRLLQ